jgi:HEPN domain-containing protein
MKDKPVKAWIELAHRDLIAAKELINNEYLCNIVLFHSQQTIEKCLKALLEQNNINPPKIHGINKLFSLLPELIKEKITLNDFEMNLIDDIYIDTRYPSNFGLLPSGFPSQEEAREVLEIADRIFNQTITLTGGFHENR